jgi:hypothetical protein
MKKLKAALGTLCACCICVAQVPEITPQVVGRTVQEGQVTVVYLAPRFATAIRMPDAINSVVLGDPDAFSAEHSEREPRIVVVKPITVKAAQTNLLITTAQGYQANLLLISRGEPGAGAKPDIDFMMRYRPVGRFIVEPSYPSALVARTTALEGTAEPVRAQQPVLSDSTAMVPASSGSGSEVRVSGKPNDPPVTDPGTGLDALLERQRRAPLPVLYGEKPGIVPPGTEILKAGVSEVIDRGKEVVVLFSVINLEKHAVELMPPQVQLGGKVKKGKIVHHTVWSTSEQLPVEDFRMSRRRIGPGERADGVLIFQRPSFKQSTETLLLQMADSGAVDRPALAPIGFGISSIRKEGGE